MKKKNKNTYLGFKGLDINDKLKCTKYKKEGNIERIDRHFSEDYLLQHTDIKGLIGKNNAVDHHHFIFNLH